MVENDTNTTTNVMVKTKDLFQGLYYNGRKVTGLRMGFSVAWIDYEDELNDGT